jgi:hypothetical protein
MSARNTASGPGMELLVFVAFIALSLAALAAAMLWIRP